MTRTHWLILVCGGLIAFVWEIFQMPFFKPGDFEPFERTIRCGIASMGDGVILLAAYSLAALRGGSAWLWQSAKTPYAIYFGFGLVVAIAVEMIATSLPANSLLSWRYSDLMPREPATGFALIPIAMWTIVPALTILLIRFARASPD
jgi:hypothetical protein|tara:strand:+ start:415 stop:855 length:441 start_codon:yes stop_codon:yes gene_type:complete